MATGKTVVYKTLASAYERSSTQHLAKEKDLQLAYYPVAPMMCPFFGELQAFLGRETTTNPSLTVDTSRCL